MLENGANSSFVNRIHDENLPIAEIVADPVAKLGQVEPIPHPRIPLPAGLYGEERRNSQGLDLFDPATVTALDEAMERAAAGGWRAAPLIGGVAQEGRARDISDPADRRRRVGEVVEAGPEQVEQALARARRAAPGWDATPADERA
ncbi:MAG: bifunctional proline dehydrogenase/L-glutamate gamma-semialdehyde dehydrogenase, partial [Rhodospirillales bacterium]|nr:bifunctional proline dehydrogenase/L-glutamate gamma-semialdehyde dehydrogenase [Rhodospirillales bacterium]